MQGKLGGCCALAALLAACASTPRPAPPPSAAEFKSMREVLATNAEARTAVQERCRADMEAKPPAERQMLSALLDLDADKVPAAFCARTVAGIARGDVSYADFVAIAKGTDDPDVLRRFIRALRTDPSALAI